MPDERRRLLILAVVIVVGAVLLDLSPLNRPSGAISDLVLGSILAGFSLVMVANPGDVRTRWYRFFMSLPARIFPQSWVRSQRTINDSAQRWHCSP
jgi:hypothetical protein